MIKHILKYNDFKINEVFDSNSKYDIKMDEYDEFTNSKSYRYSFITKDDVTYRILLTIYDKGVGKIDFDTISKNKDHISIISLINTGDVYRVMNTLKSIIDKHKEINKLIISSSEERMKFYQKLLNYLKIKNEYVDDYLVGYLL